MELNEIYWGYITNCD